MVLGKSIGIPIIIYVREQKEDGKVHYAEKFHIPTKWTTQKEKNCLKSIPHFRQLNKRLDQREILTVHHHINKSEKKTSLSFVSTFRIKQRNHL
jgi:hypothetical protein